jgi:hypothetical protein
MCEKPLVIQRVELSATLLLAPGKRDSDSHRAVLDSNRCRRRTPSPRAASGKSCYLSVLNTIRAPAHANPHAPRASDYRGSAPHAVGDGRYCGGPADTSLCFFSCAQPASKLPFRRLERQTKGSPQQQLGCSGLPSKAVCLFYTHDASVSFDEARPWIRYSSRMPGRHFYVIVQDN